VRVDGAERDEQVSSDLGVGTAPDDGLDDLDLPLRQRRDGLAGWGSRVACCRSGCLPRGLDPGRADHLRLPALMLVRAWGRSGVRTPINSDGRQVWQGNLDLALAGGGRACRGVDGRRDGSASASARPSRRSPSSPQAGPQPLAECPDLPMSGRQLRLTVLAHEDHDRGGSQS
jgi:hypothetical protein